MSRKLILIVGLIALSVRGIAADSNPIGEKLLEKTVQELDSQRRIEEQKLATAQMKYEVFRYEHNQMVFEWELFVSKMLFWIILLFIATGICLSVLQFINSNKIRRRTDAKDISTLSISEKGVEIKTAFIGLLLLIVSLGFLYLYMYTAYPIKYINPDNTVSSPTNPTK